MTEEARTPIDAWLGRLVGEKYRVLRVLGVGGHGAVFEAENSWTGRHVALKVLLGHAAFHPEIAERFLREARAATKVGHPNIIEVLDMGRDAEDGSLFIVQELLVGGDLRDLIKQYGRLDPDQAVDIVLPIADALSAAHEQGVVHRDLKPANIFLARRHDGAVVPKLIDFGVSRMREAAAETEGALTMTGVLLGTPDYMSPEQARGETSGHSSDIWAIGIVLYESLSGTRPFKGANYNALLQRILSEEIPLLHEVVSAVPRSLSAIVHRALEKRPEARYATMAALRDALLAWRSSPEALAIEAQAGAHMGATGPYFYAAEAPPAEVQTEVTPFEMAADPMVATMMDERPEAGLVPPMPDVTQQAPAVIERTESVAMPAPEPLALPSLPPSPRRTPPPPTVSSTTPEHWNNRAPTETREPRRGRAVLITVGFIAALATGGLYARIRRRATRPEPAPVANVLRVEPQPAPSVTPVELPPAPEPAPAVEDAGVETETTDGAAPEQVMDLGSAAFAPETTTDSGVVTIADETPPARVASDAGNVRRRPAPRRETVEPQRDRPDTAEVRAVFGGLTGAVRQCVQSQPGTLLVAVSVESSGRVQSVQLPTPWAGAPSGRCLVGVLQRARFAPFRDPRFVVTWPYVIPAGARP